jgi:hypothetical protein
MALAVATATPNPKVHMMMKDLRFKSNDLAGPSIEGLDQLGVALVLCDDAGAPRVWRVRAMSSLLIPVAQCRIGLSGARHPDAI